MQGRRSTLQIKLTDEERSRLWRISRRRIAPYREVVRATALLKAADGERNTTIAKAAGVDARTISLWRRDFCDRRLESLRDKPRTGRPSSFDPCVKASATHLACSRPEAVVTLEDLPGFVPQNLPKTSCRVGTRLGSARWHGFRRAPSPMMPQETSPTCIPAADCVPEIARPEASTIRFQPESGSTSRKFQARPVAPSPSRNPEGSAALEPVAECDTQDQPSLETPFSRLSAARIAWILTSLGVVASISARTVARWLKAEKLKPWRFHSWITPKRLADFLPRACAVLDLYERAKTFLHHEVIFSIDEKTSIQAREHPTHAPAGPGRPARIEHTYKRHGALALFAALNVLTGWVFGRVYDNVDKTFETFSEFLTELLAKAVAQGYTVIHLILDNASIHRPKYLQAWLEEHLRAYPGVEVVVHWLPVRSSWLNQVEIFFSVLQTQALTPNNFASIHLLRQRILGFINYWNRTHGPIKWTYTSDRLRQKYAAAAAEDTT